VKLCKGSYSWWNEPQTAQIGGPFQRLHIGAVTSSWSTAVCVDGSSSVLNTQISYLADANRYVPDDHNGPVTIKAGDGIVTFFPGHNDRDYLPYVYSPTNDPAGYRAEVRISPAVGAITYCQAFYTNDVPGQAPRVWAFFRANNNRSWYVTFSENWDAAAPTWTTWHLFYNDEDTAQLYIKAIRSAPTIVRFVLTKNPVNADVNGIWFAYVNLQNADMKTGSGAALGDMGVVQPFNLSTLTKIYTPPTSRMRLFDVQANAGGIVPMLAATFSGASGGKYRYLEYSTSSWSITKNVEIVDTGVAIDGVYYFGGAHFSPLTLADTVTASPIYIAREDDGEWLLEQYTSSNSGATWALAGTVDSSTTEKIWRPRVPYDTRSKSQPGQIVLTWCKGSYTSFEDYDSTVYGLRRNAQAL